MFNLATLIAAAALCPAPTFAQAGPSTLNISGGLFYPNGQPVTTSGVNFRLEIRDKAGTCVLYRETHTGQDLSQTRGQFSLLLGAGTSSQNFIGGGAALDKSVF